MALVGTVGLNSFRVTTSIDDDELEDNLSVLEVDLTTLTVGQRVILGIIVTVLCACSIFGNVGTLWVNKTRQLRVFFRTCLISLALSDLITSLFTSLAYLAQFAAPSVQIWCLGGVLCKMIPFMTTGAILVSSMTLLGIAFDRYYSVMRASTGFWKPDRRCSILITVCIWVLSFVISIHLYFAYTVYEVYIIREEGAADHVQIYLAAMCVSNKEANAYYYLVVLAIIFVPTLVAFVWLNSIIANKLWIRRHSFKGPPSSSLPSSPASVLPEPVAATMPGGCCSEPKEKQMEMIPQQYRHQEQHHQHHKQQHHHPRPRQHGCHCRRQDNKICTSSTLTVPSSLPPSTGGAAETKSPRSNPLPDVDGRRLKVSGGGGYGDGCKVTPREVRTAAVAGASASAGSKHISSREARHLRMFTIILILMAVFIFFRLPAWIFLILRMYGSYTHRTDWILHFSFGILTLTSCVLNPLLYTFLAETIRYAMFMKGKLCGLRRYFGGRGGCWSWCFHINNGDDSGDSQKMTQSQHQNASGGDGSLKPNPRHNASDSVNARDNDCTSNDGAKSTSRKSDDDSKVYTIIPVPERLQGCHRTQDDTVAAVVAGDGGRSAVPMLNA